MAAIRSKLKRQVVLASVLCVSAGIGMLVSPSVASYAMGLLSVLLLSSQIGFSRAHAASQQAQASVRATFDALPDAVLVIDRVAACVFSKDFAEPRAPALPLLLDGTRLQSSDLRSVTQEVQASSTPRQLVEHLPDGRILECRVNPLNRNEVLVIARDITDVHKDSERIRYLATHDSLTGLFNRSSLHVSLEQAIGRSNRSKRPFGLLFLDLDHFKAVNDTLGHEAGDSLLKEVAQRIKQSLRVSDSAYRLAGDEFTVLIEHLESDADVFLVAEKLCQVVVSTPYFADPSAPQVSASVGAVVYPRDGESADELIRLADKAMYRAKAQGRNKAAVHSDQ